MLTPRSVLLGLGIVIFASFSSNSTYQLKSYSVGPGGATNNAAAGSYTMQGSLGEQTNDSTSNASDTSNNGSVQTEQLSVPPAPTLSNGAGLYYNKLNVTINQGNDTTGDTTFAIAVQSSTNCSTWGATSYVQADGSLNSTPVYQSYITWGGSSGSFIVGLTPGTCYQAKVAAMQGKFTNTEFGAFSTAVSTAAMSLTFSVSPNSVTLSNMVPNTVVSTNPGSNISFNLTTDASFGGSIYVAGQNGGLFSTNYSHNISSPSYGTSENLSTSSDGFGLQGISTSGGLVTQSPYNGSSNTVGSETPAFAPLFSSNSQMTSGSSATLALLAKSNINDPPSADYKEILTFTAAASY